MRIPNGRALMYPSKRSRRANLVICRNDILRKHGVIPEKPPSPTPLIQEALSEARKQAYENRLENKDLDELNELEDEEDDVFLEKYRCVFNPAVLRSSSVLIAVRQGSSGWRSCPP